MPLFVTRSTKRATTSPDRLTPQRILTAGSPSDATEACEAAAMAQVGCAATAPRQRAEILRACWQNLVDHTDKLARLITLEHGKPLADARGEVAYAA
jgi:succinate-semialdehyde dehydrogenase/glutarate-semialdehyde dehydrogenase